MSWTERRLRRTAPYPSDGKCACRNYHLVPCCYYLALIIVSKRSSKLPKYLLGQHCQFRFLRRHHAAANEFEGFVTGKKAFPGRHRLALVMVLTARRDRQAGPDRPKDKGPFLRAEPALSPHIFSSTRFGSIKSMQCPLKPVKRFLQLSSDYGRDHSRAEEQLTRHWVNRQPAAWDDDPTCAPHTLHTCHTCQGSAGLAKPLFTWAREMGPTRMEPESGKLGRNFFFFFFSGYRSVVTKLRLPKDPKTVGFDVLYCCCLSFLWPLKEAKQGQGGCLADGAPLIGSPCPPLWVSSPFISWGFSCLQFRNTAWPLMRVAQTKPCNG